MTSLQKFGFMTVWLPFTLSLISAYILTFPVAPSDGWLKQLCANFYALTLLWFLFLATRHVLQGRFMPGLGMAALMVILLGLMIPLFVFGQIAENQAKKADASAAATHQAITGEGLPEAQGGADYQVLLGGPADLFQTAVRGSIGQSVAAQGPLPLGIPSLAKLRTEHPALLDRYLASHPAWRVYEEGGRRYAVRRWMNGKRWETTENGFYAFGEGAQPAYRCRTRLIFADQPAEPKAQRIEKGVLADIQAARVDGGDVWKSEVAVPAADLWVEMLEETPMAERRLTPTAFAMMEREFITLLNSTEWFQAKRHLSAGAIQSGKPSLELQKGQHPGTYHTLLRCNATAPGRIYLKAFDLSQGTSLSAADLKASSSERIGWSVDPSEQFLAACYLTIHEGKLGQPYGARFEVWFQPDDQGPEKKLLEQSFKIEGSGK